MITDPQIKSEFVGGLMTFLGAFMVFIACITILQGKSAAWTMPVGLFMGGAGLFVGAIGLAAMLNIIVIN